jgi:hypothetical protein
VTRTLAFVIAALVFLSMPSTARAMLLAFSPDKMLSDSDAIIVGTITSRVETDKSLDVTIKVERILTGAVGARTVDLSVGPYMPGANAPDAFPAEGTRVFVALRGNQDERWGLASDLNAVAMVENGHVTTLHHPTKIGINDESWSPDDYVLAYDQFYRAHLTWFDRVSEWLRNLFS